MAFISCDQRAHAGFTIIEVLLVLGLGTLLVSLALPVGLQFYRSQVSDETVLELLGAFRVAESEARLGKSANAFGVKLFPDHYVVFQGDQYTSRILPLDRNFPFPQGVDVASSTDEFVFAKVTGMSNRSGTVALMLYGRTHTIAVNSEGVVTQEN